MKKLHGILVIALLMVSATAGAQTLEELAEIVRRAASTEGQINQEREAEFIRERDNQRNLLAAARAEKRREEQRSDDLKSEYDRLERELAELTTILQERMGNLGELFGIVRQSSGDIQAALNDSMVSAQRPGRGEFLSELAQRKALPNVQELRVVWERMVTEIAESGKVVRFNTTVERANGAKEDTEVVRVGVFNAVADGSFLDWDSTKSTDNLIELARQPAARYRAAASDLQKAAPGEVTATRPARS